jgi:hypothetical protein
MELFLDRKNIRILIFPIMKKLSASAILLLLFFVTAYSQIPDYNMETWNTISTELPSGWQTHGKITKISPAPNGKYAVRMESDPLRQDIGAIVYGRVNNNVFTGGIPFHSRPDSIVGDFKFDIKPGDTAWVLVAFQKNGTYVSYDIFHINGTQNGSFTRLGFEINYLTNETPDTVFVGVTSGNPLGQKAFNSYMIVDNLHFTNTTDTIPNHSFEQWGSVSYDLPQGWYARNDFHVQTVQKTTDAFRGNYAMRIQNVLADGFLQPGFCSTLRQGVPDSMAFNPAPAFPVIKKPDTLYMYYKFLPQKGDSASVVVALFNTGKPVGFAMMNIGGTHSAYTPLKIPIKYPGGGTPDSAFIGLASFSLNGQGNAKGTSTFMVDNLSFDKLLNAGIDEAELATPGINIFPNPTRDMLNIIQDNNTRILNLEIVDITGKLVKSYSTAESTINIQNLDPGMYFLRVTTNLGIVEKKVWKE